MPLGLGVGDVLFPHSGKSVFKGQKSHKEGGRMLNKLKQMWPEQRLQLPQSRSCKGWQWEFLCDVVCEATIELFSSGKEELSRLSGFRGSEKFEWDNFWFQKYIFWLELTLEFVGWNLMYRDSTRVLYKALIGISFFWLQIAKLCWGAHSQRNATKTFFSIMWMVFCSSGVSRKTRDGELYFFDSSCASVKTCSCLNMKGLMWKLNN